MRKNKIVKSSFKFLPFSKKQKKLLGWWAEGSPHRHKKMIIADGSIRSGKTITIIVSFILWSLETFEGEKFILAARTVGTLKRNIIEEMFKILNALGISYQYVKNSDDHYILIGSNKYYLFGANDDKAFEKLRGLTAAGGYGDEASLFPRSFFDEMIARCSIKGAKLWFATNPDNPYHWFYQDFILKRKEKDILRLHFLLEDNLSLSQETIDNYKRMYTGLFYQRMILGLWVMAQGVIYENFDQKHHVTDCPKIFSKYWISCDYGTTNPCVFLLWGIQDKKAYLIREYYYSSKSDLDKGEINKQKTDGEYADDLKDFLKGIKPELIIIDPSAASFIAELKKRGYRIKTADNSVLDGIRYTANCLKDRVIFIDKSCENTIREFMSYVWDEKAQKKGEDKPIKENDHAMDALRYFLYTFFRKFGKRGIFNKPKGW